MNWKEREKNRLIRFGNKRGITRQKLSILGHYMKSSEQTT